MYHFNEGTLELPSEWKDMTINVLNSPAGETHGLSFTISRDIMPWGMTLPEFTDQQINLLQRQLTEMKVIQRLPEPLKNHESQGCEFTWLASQGKVHQLMVLVKTPDNILIFTATMADVLSANQQQFILAQLNTLVLREA